MVTENILTCLKKLRLNRSIARISEEIEADSHQEYLLKLLCCEVKRREEAKKARLVKSSGFYTLKAFDDFRFDEVTLPESVTPAYLKKLSFMDSSTNLIMYGNVGTGNYRKFLLMERFPKKCTISLHQ